MGFCGDTFVTVIDLVINSGCFIRFPWKPYGGGGVICCLLWSPVFYVYSVSLPNVASTCMFFPQGQGDHTWSNILSFVCDFQSKRQSHVEDEILEKAREGNPLTSHGYRLVVPRLAVL